MAHLNYELAWDITDWEEPYLLSKFIRSLAYPVKKCWLVTKKALSALGRFFRRHLCGDCHVRHTGDNVESGEAGTQQRVEAIEETASEGPSERVKNEFRKSLRKIFSEVDQVDRIMAPLNCFETGL